ncbi:MAG: nucleoside triphosphate pyrophosphohydrolase [Firmicutes bacterium]|nr:nucleoside triphosphate pyrophosphohydrolase [Bacillota bacterium]
MSKINIVGLGPGDIGSMTVDAFKILKKGENLYLRTKKHPVVKYLKENNINYNSYDYVYEDKESFDKVYGFITSDLVKKAKKYDIINYCVPGNPLSGDEITNKLLKLDTKENLEVDIISSQSFIEPISKLLKEDLINGTKIINGLNFSNKLVDINGNNIISQVYNKFIASEVKIQLTDVYGDDYEVFVIISPGFKEKEKVIKVPIYKLDRIDGYNHVTYIYIPKMENDKRICYNMNNLVNIMERLRNKDGCPWDMKQTHKTLREFVLEEAYEVVDAIDNDDIDNLVEELGDLLLQVVFHSIIANEEGYFNIYDVITRISEKLIYRHPHVFSNLVAKDVDEANLNWDSMKDKEKDIKTYTQRLTDIPKSLTTLSRSYKIQKKAANVGFDWNDIKDAFEKVKEELTEFEEVYRGDDKENIEEELGDLLFSIVNVSRFLNINPEIALNKTIDKFIKRFSFIEKRSIELGKDLKDMNLKEMDELWNVAKLHKNIKKDEK